MRQRIFTVSTKRSKLELFGQRAQEVLVGWASAARPFDEQPFFCTQHFTVCRTHPYAGKTRTQPRVRAFAPTHACNRTVAGSARAICKRADRLMRRIAHGAFTPRAAFGLWRHRPRLMLPHHSIV